MAKENAFLHRLGLRYPIIQAPMVGVSTPALVAAVSESGGLGSLGLGASTVEQARQMIAQTQALTDKAFNVNLFCHQPPKRNQTNERAWIEYLAPYFAQFNTAPPTHLNEIYQTFLGNSEMLAMLLEMKPASVSFHFNIPSAEVVQQLKSQGIYTLATATNLQEAQLIEQAGIDAIVAQGIEAGGHRGIFDVNMQDEQLTTNALVSLLIKQTQLPIIAAGGMMDGYDIKGALDGGAAAAQLGTAFILCPESAANSSYRQKLKSQTTDTTTLTTVISGRPARGIANQFTQIGLDYKINELPDYPIAYDIAKQLNAAASQLGCDDFSAHWAGKNLVKIREMPAALLVKTWVEEMNG
ncbi:MULTISPECIES: NAD(P)H-dependent flavin oxidoreductase [Providencia]|uniref:NAD(P)H-dependent flavin oxidoreductase n=1 Tax=Providencia TaxID=586 RepID=UPI001419AA04|nr:MULTISPECIES: nitronate monooxygenase [Providencia]ELR5277402.1 nitronate monooxygenase [Providencia rettgeri]EMB3083102.1 nitronate monooxygenase [Providencia rettgeri]NIH06633.1 nitronate monooxygenase [Providencia rettgeri]UYV42006.1 nitronate monooxygenase [Providencia rettgeri]HEC8347736.1 nitronate monooxygenase [Providencia rettgeri]